MEKELLRHLFSARPRWTTKGAWRYQILRESNGGHHSRSLNERTTVSETGNNTQFRHFFWKNIKQQQKQKEKSGLGPFPNSKRHLTASLNTTRRYQRKTHFYTGERNKRSVTKTPPKKYYKWPFFLPYQDWPWWRPSWNVSPLLEQQLKPRRHRMDSRQPAKKGRRSIV